MIKLENKKVKVFFKWLVVINCFKVRISTQFIQLLFDFWSQRFYEVLLYGNKLCQLRIKEVLSYLWRTHGSRSCWAGISCVGLYLGATTVNKIYKKVHECPTIRLPKNSLCNGFVSGLAPVTPSVILLPVYLLWAHP